MAVSRILIASLLLSLLLLHVVASIEEANTSNQVTTINCSKACKNRCRHASRKRRCMRACRSCCEKCNCVPPGYSGNENVCPCYANMTIIHNGLKHKCP